MVQLNAGAAKLGGFSTSRKANATGITFISKPATSPTRENEGFQNAEFARRRVADATDNKSKARKPGRPPGTVSKKTVKETKCTMLKGSTPPKKTQKALPHIVRSDTGDYIITPGRSRIDLNEFMATFDQKRALASETVNVPGVRSAAFYADQQYRTWRDMESKLPPEVFMLSFTEKSALEEFRRMAVVCVFNFAVAAKLPDSTVHSAILNVSRLIWSRVENADQKRLSDELFASTVLAAVRSVVKFEEPFPISCRFRLDPSYIWTASRFCEGLVVDRSIATLNAAENDALEILRHPLNPPVAPDFLDRYLVVGGWTEYVAEYKELALYILGLSLFSYGDSNALRELPCSKAAAAALVLAVKIINTDEKYTDYEYWPERLALYSGYHLADLRQGIIGLSKLMRNKPANTGIIEKYYKTWGSYDWK